MIALLVSLILMAGCKRSRANSDSQPAAPIASAASATEAGVKRAETLVGTELARLDALAEGTTYLDEAVRSRLSGNAQTARRKVLMFSYLLEQAPSRGGGWTGTGTKPREPSALALSVEWDVRDDMLRGARYVTSVRIAVSQNADCITSATLKADAGVKASIAYECVSGHSGFASFRVESLGPEGTFAPVDALADVPVAPILRFKAGSAAFAAGAAPTLDLLAAILAKDTATPICLAVPQPQGGLSDRRLAVARKALEARGVAVRERAGIPDYSTRVAADTMEFWPFEDATCKAPYRAPTKDGGE